MFHDMGLTARYNSPADQFEVDGANAARDFLRRHRIDQHEIDTVWAAVDYIRLPAFRSTCTR